MKKNTTITPDSGRPSVVAITRAWFAISTTPNAMIPMPIVRAANAHGFTLAICVPRAASRL
jgi:hypothetical protein